MRVIGILAHVLLRPRRLLHGGFMLLAVGIAWNALFLQGGPHPAPLFDDSSIGRQDAPPSASVEAVTDGTTAAPVQQGRDELIFAVQGALRDAGLYDGPIDGIAGPMTTAAIEAYERAEGRPATGVASLDLLAALSSPPAAEEGDAAPQRVDPDPLLMAVQVALSRAAYGPLPADGVFGPQTRDAIARFQNDHGLKVTGEYSESLVVDLRAVGAL
jgi:peptidoglycan hydrolase-like protein with peptidoglycan-binding domain